MSLAAEEILTQLQTFDWTDYTVFGIMLCSCLAIGLHFNLQSRQKVYTRGEETLEYLVGSKNLKVFPVSMSLLASFLSSIGLIGIPTEIYVYGFEYTFTVLAQILAGVVIHYFVLPVFYPLSSISLYEYLSRRFNRSLKLFSSILYLLSMLIKMPIVVYVPAMVLNQVAGVDTNLTVVVISIVCISYTCLGGIKAVVWTDVLQIVIMFGSLLIVAVRGTLVVGGFGTVLARNINSTRVDIPSFSLDPTMRSSFWSQVIGGTFYYLVVLAFEQSMYQRYIALPTLVHARKALWIMIIGLATMFLFIIYNGLLVFAMYHDCDPLSTGLVKRKDQLVSHLVMDTMFGYPIVRGCFVTGVLSASLSSISTILNSMSAVILEDLLKPCFGNRLANAYILRGTVITVGVLTMSLVFIVDKLGPVLELLLSLSGLTTGPILGVFVIGILMPWIRSKPTLLAGIFGVLSTGFVVFKIQLDTVAKVLSYKVKPVTIEGCLYSFNATVNPAVVDSERSFYHLSYLYHTAFGTVVTILVANVLVMFFGQKDPCDVVPELLTPWIRTLVKKRRAQVGPDRSAVDGDIMELLSVTNVMK